MSSLLCLVGAPILVTCLLNGHIANQEKNVPLSFYKTYLQPLFYNVLNTRQDMRESRVVSVPEFRDIPYLNGGLFREVVDNESGYNVDNDILEVMVEDILRKYTFTLEG